MMETREIPITKCPPGVAFGACDGVTWTVRPRGTRSTIDTRNPLSLWPLEQYIFNCEMRIAVDRELQLLEFRKDSGRVAPKIEIRKRGDRWMLKRGNGDPSYFDSRKEAVAEALQWSVIMQRWFDNV